MMNSYKKLNYIRPINDTQTNTHTFDQALGESRERRLSLEQQSQDPQTSLVQPDLSRTTGRDFFSNISSDLNGIAAQTTSMFSDLFGTDTL